MNSFLEKITSTILKNQSILCVGLDPDLDKIPRHLLERPDPIFEFNREIIQKTQDQVCAYKPNIAFYEAQGEKGMSSLRKTIEFIPKSIPIILDAKRGDIGNTSRLYAQACFDDLNVDAVTVNGYMGTDSVSPFLEYKEKAVFVLVKTSNPSSSELQDLTLQNNSSVYLEMAKKVSQWNKEFPGHCGAVVGATAPSELQVIRSILSHEFILAPGVGAQGGDPKELVRNGLNQDDSGLVVNSSRGVLYSDSSKTFAESARQRVIELNELLKK